jgi:hypothetical protein
MPPPPNRFEENTIRVPSGDQIGFISCAGFDVNREVVPCDRSGDPDVGCPDLWVEAAEGQFLLVGRKTLRGRSQLFKSVSVSIEPNGTAFFPHGGAVREDAILGDREMCFGDAGERPHSFRDEKRLSGEFQPRGVERMCHQCRATNVEQIGRHISDA